MSLVHVAAILLWVVVLARIPTIVRHTTQRLLWLSLVALAVSVTLETPDVARALDDVAGFTANISHLVKHAMVVTSAVLAREVVRDLALPAEVADQGRARRALAMTGMVALLAGLFSAAPVHDRTFPGLTAVAVGEPVLLAYWAIYLFALASALVSIARLTFTSVMSFPPGPVRTSMTWMAGGAIVGLTYCGHKAAYLVVATINGGSWPSPESMDTVQQYLLSTTVMIFVVGVLWPACTEWPVIRQLRAYLAYRRLYPLWLAYYQAEPGIALDPVSRGRRGGVSFLCDIELDLYRRVIEIRDGMLAVQRFAPPHVRELAVREAHRAGAGVNAQLIGEAAWLEVARRAKLRGGEPHDEPMPAPTGGEDLSTEILVLTEITAARKMIGVIVRHVEATIGAES